MGNRMFNVARGAWRYYLTLPGSSDAFGWALFKAAGIQADDVLDNYSDLASIKALNAEADFQNYGRIYFTATGPTGVNITQDNTANKVNLDVPDSTIAAAGSAVTPMQLAALIGYYRPQSNSPDSDCIPLFKFDFPAYANGSDLIIRPDATGLLDSTG